MDCPQCHTLMDQLKKPGFGWQLLSGLLGGAAESPSFRCPKCRTEITSPIGDDFVLYIENLEDFRKSCRMQLSHQRGVKPLVEEGLTEAYETNLAKIERFVSILDAMTLEERLQPDLLGPAERERVVAESGTTAADLDELLAEFTEIRTFYQEFRSASFWSRWQPLLVPAVALLIGVGMAVLALFNDVVATVLGFLGCYSLSLIVLYLVLPRFMHASPIVGFSLWRGVLFKLVLPGAMAAGLFFLLHDWVVQAGVAPLFVGVGCFAVPMLVLSVESWVSLWHCMREIRRAQRAAMSGTPAQSDPPAGP